MLALANSIGPNFIARQRCYLFFFVFAVCNVCKQGEMEKCKICNESFSDGNTLVVLRAKGSDGVNRASAQRLSSLVTIPGDRVHIECRRSYCKAENIARDNVIPSLQQPQIKLNLRSEQNFNFQEHCLFCGQPTEIP